MQPTRRQQWILYGLLALALVLRVGYGLAQDAVEPFYRLGGGGGDTWWYLEYSYRLVTDIQMEPLSPAPVYPALLGGLRYLLQPQPAADFLLAAPPGGGLDVVSVPGEPVAAVVIIVRVVQAMLDTATVYFAYRITRALVGRVWPALGVAAVLATSLAMIVTAAHIHTETLYMFFLSAGMMLYVEQVGRTTQTSPLRNAVWLGVCGGLLALAALTRAVLVLFPIGLLIHALLLRWQGGRSAVTVRGVMVLLAVYVAFHASWTSYYYARWGDVVVGARGVSAFFYLGTQAEVPGPAEIDAELGATTENPVDAADYTAGASATIAAAPLDYLAGRGRNLLRAYAQPYGTNAFAGESIRAGVQAWARDGYRLGGLVTLTRSDAFWPKLLIYLVHYGGIALGAAGLWRNRERWPVTLPLAGLIVYVTVVHVVLLALPRYLFPLLPFWWCLAGGVFAARRP